MSVDVDGARVVEQPWLTMEKSFLGAVLLTGDFRSVEHMIQEDEFYRPANGLVWGAMAACARKGEVVEPVAVMGLLLASGDLRAAGGAEYLHELVSSVSSGANAVFYAQQVQANAAARRLSEMGAWLQSSVQPGVDTRMIESEARVRLSDVHPHATQNARLVGDLLEDLMNDLETDGFSESLTGLVWPYRDVNEMVVKMSPGQLIVIGARPAMGKSLACLDVARHVAMRQNKTVVFHSLEMSALEVMRRMMSAESGVALERIIRKSLTSADWDAVSRATARINDAPLFVDERTKVGVSDIRASVRSHAADLVIGDYLGLMQMPRMGGDRHNDVAALSRELKILAKEESLPVIVAHQLNRNVTARADNIPQMSDLRESGALEQDADLIILLHREDYYQPESPRAGEVDWIVAKQRAGRSGTVPLVALLHQAKFGDLG